MMKWQLRPAIKRDVDAIEQLITLSVHGLQSAYYSTAQIESAFGPAYGVDRALIRDGSYFVVEQTGALIACGGWSRRKAFFGGDDAHGTSDALLDPETESARLRAFFVHPDWARRGLGRTIVAHCEKAISEAGFSSIELVATLPGEPLYAACGYEVLERYEVPLSEKLELPVIKMRKILARKHG